MAHIKLVEGLPGIIGPMKTYPETAKPLNDLAETLLCQETATFSKAERETVANYVSYLNNCQFCSESHAAVADIRWKKKGLSKKVWENPKTAGISNRLQALLNIAAKVQNSGRSVTKQDVEAALKEGATERDVHDTVLIAAAFCMYNRYVDGLGTFAPPRDSEAYQQIGQMLVDVGYKKAA